MAAGLRAGLSAKLYRNTATWATPTWDEITAAQNVTLNLTMNMAEVKARLSAFVQNLTTLKVVGFSFNMINDTSIADHNILRDAHHAGTLVGYAVADDAIATSGTEHYRLEGYLTTFNVTQNLEEAMMVDCAVVPAYSANVPVWTDVA